MHFVMLPTLGLMRRIHTLRAELQEMVGSKSFLESTRFVISHPVGGNIFRRTYRMNFLPTSLRGRDAGRGGRDLCVPHVSAHSSPAT